MRSLHVAFAALCLATLSCSGGQTSVADASARGLCPGEKQQSQPLIVEWSSSARGQLEALRSKHVVAVRYSGCELEVLAQCNVPARYAYAPITPKHERITVHDDSELFANIPLHAAALSGKLKSAGELNVEMTVVGRFEAEHAEVRPEELSGDCAGATHVIAGLSAGAFSFYSGSDKSAGAGVDVGGLGTNAKTSTKREVLNEDGDKAACSTAAPGDKAPPFKCGALVRIELVPIGSPKQDAPSCSQATQWDGKQCVSTEGGGGACPPGTLSGGGNCVPEDGKTCPAGWRFEEGPRCMRDVGPAAPGACPAETHREGGGCVANAAGPGPMVRILGNTFVMGSHCPNGDCQPSHRVTVPTFDIDLLEVSVAAYKACVDARRCVIPMADGQCNWGKDGRQHHPINCVDWAQSKIYCEWAGRRLPTEAEWEFAAVGQTGWEYPWGNERPEKKHDCHPQSPSYTCPGGTAMDGRSRFGVLDMYGNVSEWTADAWCYYRSGDEPPRCEPNNRVLRNGPHAADRTRHNATSWAPDKGFRCAKTP